MTDEGTAKQKRYCNSVRIEFIPKEMMPDGLVVVPIERSGELIWGVLEGEMSDRLRSQINQTLEHLITSGLWRQNWPADGDAPRLAS